MFGKWRRKSANKTLVVVFVFLFALLIWYMLKDSDDRFFVYISSQEYLQMVPKRSKEKLAVVVPFRDRWPQLKQFLPQMYFFLSAQDIEHEFFIINQVDDHRFNRATLINIGFLESRKTCSDILVHDVDLVPATEKLKYYQVFPGPYHCIPPEVHPKYHYKKFVGGAIIFSENQFKQIDGLSNKFWGWGGEDDEMFKRIKDAGLKIYRQKGLPSDITFTHLHSESKPGSRDDQFTFNQLIHMYRRDRRTGLHTTQYFINGTKTYKISSSTVNIINVTLTCDVHQTPWCYRLDQLSPEVLRQENKRNYFWYKALDWIHYQFTGTT